MLKKGDIYDGKEGLILYAQYKKIPSKIEDKIIINPEIKEIKEEKNPVTKDHIILCFILLILSMISVTLFLKIKNKYQFQKEI